MRWRLKHFLAIFLVIFCLFCFFSADRLGSRGRGIKNGEYLPPDKVILTKISGSSQVVFGMRDNRDGNMGKPSARFLVVTAKNLRFHCRFPSGIEVPATSYEFSENHNMLYGVYYVNCVIPKEEPPFVTVDISEESDPKWIPVPITYLIHDERGPKSYLFNYGLCVPVLYGEKYSGKNLAEFMELNRLLGVERVTIYTDGKRLKYDLRKTIDYYSKQGFLQEIVFQLPEKYSKIWYHGQLAVITDCLARHTGTAKYVAFHDLDEYLVPTEEQNVPTVLKKKLKGKVGSLRVHTQYMSFSKKQHGELLTLEAVEHFPMTDPTFTKCVLRPEMVFEQGIHHTSRVIQDDYSSPHADVADLKLFHYKNRGGGKTSTRIADVYGKELIENYNFIVQYLNL